jgi:hypothetical protein
MDLSLKPSILFIVQEETQREVTTGFSPLLEMCHNPGLHNGQRLSTHLSHREPPFSGPFRTDLPLFLLPPKKQIRASGMQVTLLNPCHHESWPMQVPLQKAPLSGATPRVQLLASGSLEPPGVLLPKEACGGQRGLGNK